MKLCPFMTNENSDEECKKECALYLDTQRKSKCVFLRILDELEDLQQKIS